MRGGAFATKFAARDSLEEILLLEESVSWAASFLVKSSFWLARRRLRDRLKLLPHGLGNGLKTLSPWLSSSLLHRWLENLNLGFAEDENSIREVAPINSPD